VQLVADQGLTDIKITYSTPRGDDLDTRLLRAMVIKGILEETTTSNVNLVGGLRPQGRTRLRGSCPAAPGTAVPRRC
jgi:hypothetical protein